MRSGDSRARISATCKASGKLLLTLHASGNILGPTVTLGTATQPRAAPPVMGSAESEPSNNALAWKCGKKPYMLSMNPDKNCIFEFTGPALEREDTVAPSAIIARTADSMRKSAIDDTDALTATARMHMHDTQRPREANCVGERVPSDASRAGMSL